MLRNRVKPHIGDVRLSKLTPADVRAMYRRLLSDGLTPSTVGNVHVILKQALRDAVRGKYIRTNPWTMLSHPSNSGRKRLYSHPTRYDGYWML